MWNTSSVNTVNPVDIAEWFRRIRKQYAGQMQCGKGCTACCHGLFDISQADAVDVARGFEHLPEDVQSHSFHQSLPNSIASGNSSYSKSELEAKLNLAGRACVEEPPEIWSEGNTAGRSHKIEGIKNV